MRARWLCVLAIGMGTAAASATEPRLNLLIVTADDMDALSSGWMGSTLGTTPNLDAFAAGCFRFEQLHVSASICQPSRSALMTGRVPHRSGALGFDPVRRDVPTLPEVLRGRGYFTAALNKGGHMRPPEKFPWDRVCDPGKSPTALVREFEACLQAAAASSRPFFINANITDPHRPFPGGAVGPLDPPEEATLAELGRVFRPEDVEVPSFLEDLPAVRREVAQYDTAVARFDVSFGALLRALKAAGHEADTLIVFLSDNGMSFPFGKATVYRHGTWSPTLFRWPGLPRPGVNRTDLVSGVDLMPTMLDLLGVAGPSGMDGRSLVPLMRGQRPPVRDHVVTHVNTVSKGKSFPQRCVRTQTRSLMFHPWADGRRTFRVEAMVGLSYEAMASAARSDARLRSRVAQYTTGSRLAFYDLERDPDERRNLIDDPRYRGDVDRLASLLLAHMERTGDPELPGLRRALADRGRTRWWIGTLLGIGGMLALRAWRGRGAAATRA